MIAVRDKAAADQDWVEAVLRRAWGGSTVVVHGERFDAALMPALIAGDHLGLLTYRIASMSAEIVTLNALLPLQGAGTALVEALAKRVASPGIVELRVTTTNDNLDALRFYQRRGFGLAVLRPGAVDAARRLKPSIPIVGKYGIARHDEIELARALA